MNYLEKLRDVTRELVSIGGSDMQIVDGRQYEIIARPVTESTADSAVARVLNAQEADMKAQRSELMSTIDGLCEAIHEQCGMRATLSQTRSDYGFEARVQVRLVPDADPDTDGHWRFFNACNEDELPAMRDALAQFVIDNRKQEAA